MRDDAEEVHDINEDDVLVCRECETKWQPDELIESNRVQTRFRRGEEVLVEGLDNEATGEVVKYSNDCAIDYETDWTSRHTDLYELWQDEGVEIEADEKVVIVALAPIGDSLASSNQYAYPESMVKSLFMEAIGAGSKGSALLLARKLHDEGYTSIGDIASASLHTLTSIDGINRTVAREMKQRANDISSDKVQITRVCPGCKHGKFYLDKDDQGALDSCHYCDEPIYNSEEYVEEGDQLYCSIECLNDKVQEEWNS